MPRPARRAAPFAAACLGATLAGALVGGLLTALLLGPPPERAGVPVGLGLVAGGPAEPGPAASPVQLGSELAPVASGPPPGASVPEPGLLWILGFSVLYALYLPPRSW